MVATDAKKRRDHTTENERGSKQTPRTLTRRVLIQQLGEGQDLASDHLPLRPSQFSLIVSAPQEIALLFVLSNRTFGPPSPNEGAAWCSHCHAQPQT